MESPLESSDFYPVGAPRVVIMEMRVSVDGLDLPEQTIRYEGPGDLSLKPHYVAWWRRGRVELPLKHGMDVVLAACSLRALDAPRGPTTFDPSKGSYLLDGSRA